MLYNDQKEDIAVHVTPGDTTDLENLQFGLVCNEVNDLQELLQANLARISYLQAEGYSKEAIEPYEEAKFEILIELRTRGYEADYDGNIYRSLEFKPVPLDHQQAYKRQVMRLKHMPAHNLQHICTRTVSVATQEANRDTKFNVNQ